MPVLGRMFEYFNRVASSRPANFIRGLPSGPGFKRGRALASELYGGMKNEIRSSGFAAQAALFGGGGAAAGYFYGDGDLRTTAKGAGLGVLGAIGHRGFRVGKASYRGGLLGKEASALRRGARNWASSTYHNAIADVLDERAGMLAVGIPGQRGPAMHWTPGARGAFMPGGPGA